MIGKTNEIIDEFFRLFLTKISDRLRNINEG